MKNTLLTFALLGFLSAGALAVEKPFLPVVEVESPILNENKAQEKPSEVEQNQTQQQVEELELHFDAVEFDADYVPFKLESDTESV